MGQVQHPNELNLFITGTDTDLCLSNGQSTKTSVRATESHQAQELQMALRLTVNEYVAFEFGKIPEVRYVYTARHDSVFYVRVVVHDNRDRNLRRQIYAKELEMIEEFKKVYDFDFGIVTAPELVDPSLYLAYQRDQTQHTGR